MKKSLIALSIVSVFGVQAYAQMSDPVPTPKIPVTKEVNDKAPDTTKLNKKVVKENERTQKDLSKDKISTEQAATLDKNESKIAKDITDAKSDGDVTRDEKKYINKEVDRNQDMRDDMKKAHKDVKKQNKDMDKTATPPVTPASK